MTFLFATRPSVGLFDTIFDRAAMTAVDPELRAKYVATLHRMLAPGGKILFIFPEYDQSKMLGPPWSITRADFLALFKELEEKELRAAIEKQTLKASPKQTSADSANKKWPAPTPNRLVVEKERQAEAEARAAAEASARARGPIYSLSFLLTEPSVVAPQHQQKLGWMNEHIFIATKRA